MTNTKRIAVLGGIRTPFTKIHGSQSATSATSLGVDVTGHLVDKFDLKTFDPAELHIAWGSALSYPEELYGGREIALRLGLNGVDGHKSEYACATSIRTAVDASLMLKQGYKKVAIAGGSESLSNQPTLHSPRARQLLRVKGGSSNPDYVNTMLNLTLEDLMPRPRKAAEPVTGENMAYFASSLMSQWGVTRSEADQYALESHRRASAARAMLAKRILTTSASGESRTDEFIRDDATISKLESLPEVDPRSPGITAGNASPLTDGAAGIVLSTEEWAVANGYKPMGYIREAVLNAHDPNEGVLLGPAFTIPIALERARLKLSDIDVIDFHEAFAGQVLSNIRALDSKKFAQKHSLHNETVGSIDPASINRWGGSVSIGHPFGATGARLIMQVLDQLTETGGQLGMLSLCVGGTRGAAIIVERE